MPGISEVNSAQLAKVLADLGNTADQVAKTLHEKGIKGARNTARFLNVLVRYAQGCVTVEGFRLDLMQGDRLRLTLDDKSTVDAVLPHAVRHFLDAFNQGDYPEVELRFDHR
jgi:hypothetical protein